MLPRRSIVENPKFTQQLAEFGDARFTDKLLDKVKDILSKTPYEFPELIPNSNIRHVKTNEFFSDGRIIPALKIWFTIPDDERVTLLSITRAIDDEFDELIT